MNIKAIETKYKGYRFRSRLEARWAVFFDAMGIEWEYEKEGFDLSQFGNYLPDFWLPIPRPHYAGSGYWLEIKPDAPSDLEMNRCESLAKQTGHCTFLAGGNIGDKCHVWKWYRDGSMVEDRTGLFCDLVAPSCHCCDFAETIFDALATVLGAPKAPWAKDCFVKARSARFEHGETPR